MMNNICLTYFVATSFFNVVQSGDIGVNGKNLENVKEIRKISGNEMSTQDIGGIPISELAGAYNVKMRHLRSYNYNGNKNAMGLFERNGHNGMFEFDDGNPDVHGEILRPCQAYDMYCIRNYFAEHSKCKISGRALPDPLRRAQGSVNFASNNMSETQNTAVYGGLNNARVSEFYINKVTDNLVIAIIFDSATKYSNYTYFKYYLRGREPVITGDVGGIQYGILTVTAIIPNLHNLNLERSEVYTYGDTFLYPFALGPRIAISRDPEVTAMYARFYTNVPVEYQEEIYSQGYFMAGNYIQYNICDFGVKFV